MDFSVVLNHLQNLYPGQLVLYCDDIAKILGKSDKAIDHLITRDTLPFKVKKVGGQRCVDIFQVAQWLCCDEAIVKECVGEAPKSVKSKPKAIQPAKPSGTQTSPGSTPKVLTGNLAAAVLKMRHDQATAMRRLVHVLRDNEDIIFMNEVMEKLFYSLDQLPSSYIVTIRRLALMGAKPLAEETRTYCLNETDGLDVIYVNIVDWKYSKDKATGRYSQFNQHMVLEFSGQTLFHAIIAGTNITIVECPVDFDLPEF